MKWYESRLAGVLGGALVVGAVSFFTLLGTDASARILIAATGAATFSHIGAVYGIARVQKPPQ